MAIKSVNDTSLISVANAIRAKGKTEDTLTFPAGFVEAIENIKTDSSIPENDVMFVDYDGTPLYGYTSSEFLSMTALPKSPDRTGDGLTSDGWTHTLAEAQEYVQKYGSLDIGALYHPTDGCTHIFVDIPSGAYPASYFSFTGGSASGGTIHWGDGATSPLETSSGRSHGHSYKAPGKYEIIIESQSPLQFRDSYNIVGEITFSKYSSLVTKIYLGNVTYVTKLFSFLHNLKSIVISPLSELQNTLNDLFRDCYNLKCAVFPRNLVLGSTSSYLFYNCFSIKNIIIPKVSDQADAKIEMGFASSCYELKRLTFPVGTKLTNCSVPNTSGNNITSCIRMKELVLPDEFVGITGMSFCSRADRLVKVHLGKVSQIGSPLIAYSYFIFEITIPESVTSIASGVFQNCDNLRIYHMKPTTPPTLGSSTALFKNNNPVIYVPHGCLEAYKTATNWSAYAQYMVEEDA